MTKAELISAIAEGADIPKATAEKALNSAIDAVTKCLKKKDSISLTGFGTFKAVKRKARVGRNPQTGDEIKIKAGWVPKFTAGKSLKEAVHR